jgi:DNA-binding transcriptional ArsR family regulator
MVQYSAAGLDSVLSAVADPTRRAIINQLALGPARLSDIAAPFPMSLTGFCKHVRILEQAGLVERTRQGRENTLSLTAEPLREVARWALTYESFWQSRLTRLEAFFAAKAKQEKRK